MNFTINRKELLESFNQFIRKKYFIVFLFNFLLRLIIKIPIYVVASIVYEKNFSMLDSFAAIAMTWYVGLPLREAKQFVFMPLLIQIFSLNFIICPYLTWLMIDLTGYSVGFAVVFHLMDKRMEEWNIKKSENFLELYIVSNLLFPVSYLKWNQTFGLLLMLVSLTVYFIFEEKLHFSLIFAILSALTHLYGWVLVSILIIYTYKDRRYFQYIIPTFVVLLQFFFFYIRTGDFLLYFHGQQAYKRKKSISYPFNWMIFYSDYLTTNLYLATLYISVLWSILIVVLYLYYYIRNDHIDKLNLVILLYFIFVHMMFGTKPSAINRYSVLILPFCAILILIKFMNGVDTRKLWILIAILFVVNILLIWYLILADFLNVSDIGVIYEKASNYIKTKIG